ncbi:hypothetical protein LCGC14_2472230, partial [marine sediment metagenome]
MKECIHCKKLFKDGKREKYCSDKCREIFWNRKQYAKPEHRNKILTRMKSKEHRKKDREYKKTPARRQHRREYLKVKRRTDPLWKLEHSIRDRVRSGILLAPLGKFSTYLGYTIQELYDYLSAKDGYDESSYLAGELSLDHIIPLHWFITLEVGDKEFRKAWNMRNLRIIPLRKN